MDELLQEPNISVTKKPATDPATRRVARRSAEPEEEPCVPNNQLADIPYSNASKCIVKPRNGVCIFKDLEIVNGCCTLKTNKNSVEVEMTISIVSVLVTMAAVDIAIQAAISRGSNLGKAIINTPAVQSMAKNIIKKMTGRTVTKFGTSMSVSGASKIGSKAAAKLATDAAIEAAWRIGVAAGLKASAKAKLMAIKAKLGPVGWAMVALEVASIALDVTDPQGYSTFVSNKYLKDMRDYIEFSLYEAFSNTGYDWPLIFDVRSMYIDEFVAAYEWAKTPFIKQAMDDVLKCKTLAEKLDMNSWFGEYAQKVLQYLNRDPKQRDEKIYAKMVELLEDKSKNIKLYPFLSTTDVVGISLSAEGVDVWNGMTDAERLEKLNKSDPGTEPITEDIFKDFKLIMADTYRVPDNPPKCRKPHKLVLDHIIQAGKEVGNFFSGGRVDTSECVPVMNDRKLAGEVPMYIIPFSEDICLHGTDGLIKETTGVCGNYQGKDFGVTWNPNTNLCNYTRSYCDRMGLDYDSATKDCDLYPGQDEVEMFFPTGTTITRNVMRYGIAVKNCDSEEVRRSKGYPDVHTCRMGELSKVGNEIKKYTAIDDCKSNPGGYRNSDECMAARTFQAIASTAFYFVPGGFIMKAFGVDCEFQWAKPMIEGIVNAAEATGEFFTEDFVDFFEDDVGGFLGL
ncbi:hypothetical protein N9095_00145 [bacterium]|nr:hypothetical protein [bacterium]